MNSYQRHLLRISDIQEHLGLLHGLALQCDQVVELGFRTGVSASAFLAAGCRLRSYDIDVKGCKPHARLLAKEDPKTFEFKVGDSVDVEIPRCDLLFIDTDHTYRTTSLELRAHQHCVETWIALHDTVSFGRKDRPKSKHAGAWKKQGVLTAVEDFVSESGDWKFWLQLNNNNGLTLLRRVG